MTTKSQHPLSNLQLELLKTFSRNVPDEDLLAIRKMLTQYFAQKAAAVADEVWESEGFSKETVTAWRKAHLRTPYKHTTSGSAE
ncbi:hypothetical protein [Fibrella aquatilis]|uniref:Uncharacterized protein n=1 Tax=Fibrella aquatilis TaxID=2817059 RepID=A0A939K2A2_9BACT|nr:hypothetical protein [Fibrella aquatilis]MBO0934343.1 hypothetical protein [Fibrella aquatilis]